MTFLSTRHCGSLRDLPEHGLKACLGRVVDVYPQMASSRIRDGSGRTTALSLSSPAVRSIELAAAARKPFIFHGLQSKQPARRFSAYAACDAPFEMYPTSSMSV